MARIFILALVGALCGHVLADDPLLTRGLGARLIVVPVKNPSAEGPDFYVRLELTNDGVEGSAGPILNRFRLSLMPEDLHLRVVDENGKELARSLRTEDQMIAPWNVEVPPGGRLDFPIGEGGDRPYKNATGGPGKMLGFGLGNEWIIPPDGKTYYLCGTLHEDRPGRFRDSRVDNLREWVGSVDLQKVALPY